MNVLDFFWTFVVVFLFIAYLMILFSIIGDLFSDHKLNGWYKALWIIFLIAIPFLTALIYLIARGNGMAQRRQAAFNAAKKEQDNYIRSVAGTSHTDQLADAAKLKKSGAITDAEYTALKKKILAS